MRGKSRERSKIKKDATSDEWNKKKVKKEEKNESEAKYT